MIPNLDRSEVLRSNEKILVGRLVLPSVKSIARRMSDG